MTLRETTRRLGYPFIGGLLLCVSTLAVSPKAACYIVIAAAAVFGLSEYLIREVLKALETRIDAACTDLNSASTARCLTATSGRFVLLFAVSLVLKAAGIALATVFLNVSGAPFAVVPIAGLLVGVTLPFVPLTVVAYIALRQLETADRIRQARLKRLRELAMSTSEALCGIAGATKSDPGLDVSRVLNPRRPKKHA